MSTEVVSFVSNNCLLCRISVRQEESPGYPPGLVSNYFHNKIDIGSKIEVVMPCGTFVLKTSERDVVLIAGTY